MSSFINLMASDIWSEADIVRRTEAMIYSQFSKEQEAILNRKATGAALGQYTLTPEEAADLARYAQVTEDARQAGNAARADMALLLQVFDVEAALRRLALPEVEPVEGNEAEVEQDQAERQAAQDTIDNASTEVMALVEQRNPQPEEEDGSEESEA